MWFASRTACKDRPTGPRGTTDLNRRAGSFSVRLLCHCPRRDVEKSHSRRPGGTSTRSVTSGARPTQALPRGFLYDRIFGAGGKRSTTSTFVKRESSNASLACKSVVDIVRHRPSIQTPLRARHRMRCAIFRGGGRVQTPPSRNSTDATNQAMSSPRATSLLAILQDCA